MARKTPDRWQSLTLRQALDAVQGRLSDRKCRLLACACVRRLRSARGGGEKAVELAERFAEGRASAHELAAARYGGRFLAGHPAWAVCWSPDQEAMAMTERALCWVAGFMSTEEAAQADLLREIASDPFQPPRVDPLWLAWEGGTVVRLAQTIHDERAFAQMPVLGDALEEAGCQDQTMLEHCRQAREHVLGCWLVDLLLEKE
jgi:hypothetical protein